MNKNIWKIIFVIMIGIFFLVGCGEEQDQPKEDSTPKIEMIEEVNELALKEEYCLLYNIKNGIEAESTFTSSDESIIRIEEDGYITAKKAGVATVTIITTLTTGEVLTKELVIKVVDKTVYKIQFQLAGGKCDVEYGEVLAGADYVLPTPTKDHAIFDGWIVSGTTGKVTKIENVTSNITVRATWIEYYKLNLELNGGTLNDTVEEYIKEGTVVSLPTLTKEGNTFLGWGLTKTSTSYISELTLTSNSTIYAIFRPTRIDITFDCDGGIYNGPRVVTYADNLALGQAQKSGFSFLGWSLTKGSTEYITKLENVKKEYTLYANYEVNSNYKDFIVTNLPIEGIIYKSKLQLAVSYQPSTLSSGKLSYESSNKTIFSVSSTGEIEALRAGVATLTVTLKGTETITHDIEINVYIPGTFEVSYDSTSYVTVGEKIKLNAKYINKNGDEEEVLFNSRNNSIATVDKTGTVKGIANGSTSILLSTMSGASFDMGVTVVASNASAAVKFVLSSHESNVFTRYNLNIGGTYNTDIFGSITDCAYNDVLTIDRSLEAIQANVTSNHAGKKSSTEFICVHYTGNMASGADAKANASYFAQGGNGTSIHYTTGNDGVFHVLDDSLIGFHAGDGHTEDDFYWRPSGVKVEAGDPATPVWGISENAKFTINGRETNQDVPEGETEATKRVTSNSYSYGGAKQQWINQMGLAWMIVDGEYYMGTTWWCYDMVAAGRICNKGGNMNSIGIESCVNKGSDLWETWHITAKLVAQLMEENKLDITRVVGHHFYSAKNCPQPMMENDMEIWYKFVDLVKAEYALRTDFKDYTFKLELVGGGDEIRTAEKNETQMITYTVTIKHAGLTETVTLSSVLNGLYAREN